MGKHAYTHTTHEIVLAPGPRTQDSGPHYCIVLHFHSCQEGALPKLFHQPNPAQLQNSEITTRITKLISLGNYWHTNCLHRVIRHEETGKNNHLMLLYVPMLCVHSVNSLTQPY